MFSFIISVIIIISVLLCAISGHQKQISHEIVENKQLALNHCAIKQLATLYGLLKVFLFNRICKYFFCDLFIH